MRPSPLYLDSNVFIDLVEGSDAFGRGMVEFFELLAGHPESACTSELTLAEVLAPRRGIQPELAEVDKRYRELILDGGFIRLLPVTREVLLATSGIRAGLETKLPDAIHVATALAHGCRRFISRDRRLTSLPGIITRQEVGFSTLPELATLVMDLA